MRRGAPPDVADAIDRARANDRTPFQAFGPVMEVNFPSAGLERDLVHGLGAIPTGVLVVASEGGHVQVSRLAEWPNELAFLRADADNTRARVVFCITTEAINAAT